MKRIKDLVLTLLFLSITTSASPRMVSLAAGDCGAADLREGARLFNGFLTASLPEAALIDSQKAIGALKSPPSFGAEEISRMLDTARSYFYNSNYSKAQLQLDEAQRAIEALPPGQERWKLFLRAQLLDAQVAGARGQPDRAEQAFRRILSLQPDFSLTAELNPPSLRLHFSRAKEKLASEPKALFMVRSEPSGADVFLDGFAVGKTPLTARLFTGMHQMILAKGTFRSFSRPVRVGTPETAHVDLELEGAIQLTPGSACIDKPNSRPEQQLREALKLAAFLGAEELTLVRVLREKPSSVWLAATVADVSSATEVRRAAVKRVNVHEAEPVLALVQYVATGKTTRELASVPLPPELDAPSVLEAAPEPDPGPADSNDAHPPPDFTVASDPFSGARSKAWIPAVAGSILAASGAAMYFMAKRVETDLVENRMTIVQPYEAMNRGKALERVGLGLGILGAVGLGAAGAMYWLSPAPAESFAVAPLPGGGALATFAGRLP
jgi:hypothetical protein